MQRCSRHGQTGALCSRLAVNERLASWLSMARFVVLAVYVSVAGLRLALLLWQRFAAA